LEVCFRRGKGGFWCKYILIVVPYHIFHLTIDPSIISTPCLVSSMPYHRPPNFTSSLLPTTADATVHTAPTATSIALAMFRLAHLSINSCTVSPSAANASTFLLLNDAVASSSFLPRSLSLVGAMARSVKGTMLGRRMVARAFRRKGVDLGSSVRDVST
jgi:hypothetical protein